eukprot:358188-Chlamydomonas_euryale.AAC.5
MLGLLCLPLIAADTPTAFGIKAETFALEQPPKMPRQRRGNGTGIQPKSGKRGCPSKQPDQAPQPKRRGRPPFRGGTQARRGGRSDSLHPKLNPELLPAAMLGNLS